jgi:hypothetical protein
MLDKQSPAAREEGRGERGLCLPPPVAARWRVTTPIRKQQAAPA